MSDERACHYCGVTYDRSDIKRTELRPYGPGGAWVCFPCAFNTPERKAETEANIATNLEAASAMGGGVAVIGVDLPPSPASEEMQRLVKKAKP